MPSTWAEAVARVAAAYREAPGDVDSVLETAINSLAPDEKRWAVQTYLLHCARQADRMEARGAEERALPLGEAVKSVEWNGKIHGYVTASQGRKSAHLRDNCQCKECRDYGESLARNEAAFAAIISDATDRVCAMIGFEVGSELLDTPFKLRDGTSILWGDATEEQHRERMVMLDDNFLRPNLETKARHAKTIEVMRAANTKTLRRARKVSA